MAQTQARVAMAEVHMSRGSMEAAFHMLSNAQQLHQERFGASGVVYARLLQAQASCLQNSDPETLPEVLELRQV